MSLLFTVGPGRLRRRRRRSAPPPAELLLAEDSFTGTAGTLLDAHAPELGPGYTRETASTTNLVLSANGRVRGADSVLGAGMYSVTGLSEADVAIDFDAHILSNAETPAVWARGTVSGANSTSYQLLYQTALGSWQLRRNVAGQTSVLLAEYVNAIPVGTSEAARLVCRGSRISFEVAGVERGAATDTAIAGAGKLGIRLSSAGGSETVGAHVDNLRVTRLLP